MIVFSSLMRISMNGETMNCQQLHANPLNMVNFDIHEFYGCLILQRGDAKEPANENRKANRNKNRNKSS
jgi:hypothetical protein